MAVVFHQIGSPSNSTTSQKDSTTYDRCLTADGFSGGGNAGAGEAEAEAEATGAELPDACGCSASPGAMIARAAGVV